MKTYIVQLESHDDILSARDKIAWSKATRVLLVWPRKGKVLDRRVDLLLLLRACHQRGVQMAIVTRSGEVKAHARDLGIPVFASPAKAQSSPWRRRTARDRKLLENEAGGPRKLVASELLRAQRDALVEPQKQPGTWSLPIRLAIFTVGVLSFLALVLFFAPAARVELTLRRETQKLSIPVWASLTLPVRNPSGGVPAKLVMAVIEGRDQGKSTGQTRIPDGTATGQVQLTNLTDQPVEVPSGSLVQTLDNPPVHFMTTKAVTVPPGGKPGSEPGVMVAPIRAAAPGRAGTVGVGMIRAMEGPIGLRLAVENPLPTSGGTERSAPAPNSADYQALKEKLLADLKASAMDDLQGKLNAGQSLLELTLAVSRVVEESQQPAVDQPGERFELVLRVEFTAWVVEEADLRAVSEAALEANREKAFRPLPESLRFVFASKPQKVDLGGEDGAPAGSVRWDLEIERTLEVGWSRDQVVQRILGRPVRDAVGILRQSLPLESDPRIDLYPAWWGWLPFLPFRIEMVTS